MKYYIRGKKLVIFHAGEQIAEFWINYISEKEVCIQRATSRQRIPLSKISFS